MPKPGLAPFAYHSWREAVRLTAAELGGCCDAIAPFGFEITRDRSFLLKRLTRFYTYLSISRPEDAEASEHQFCCRLLQKEAILPSQVRRVRLVVNSRTHLIRTDGTSGSLYVRGLILPSEQTLLQAYSYYVATSPLAICAGNLKEIALFDVSPSARRLVFQLTVVASYVYPDLVALSIKDHQRLSTLIKLCPDRDQNSGASLFIPPSDTEADVARNLVMPVHRTIKKGLDRNSIKGVVQAVDFHSGEIHKYYSDYNALDAAAHAVERAMNEYPEMLTPDAPRGEILNVT
ncbi:hypothetical protein FDG2_2670 [Candidatus Protofrankia californiensis]|uniref:Uncharacterized protein n=1 Tax=Candidatus Protofrankia californiensis TaxID=1839754 RepID=A0A1C3NY08_9ACTN|nr:hypothetical protein FDG2_2670 [Candidatus Protofrankia californiensis]